MHGISCVYTKGLTFYFSLFKREINLTFSIDAEPKFQSNCKWDGIVLYITRQKQHKRFYLRYYEDVLEQDFGSYFSDCVLCYFNLRKSMQGSLLQFY